MGSVFDWRLGQCLVVFCLALVCATGAVGAEYRIGINVGVSYAETEADVVRRYTPFLNELGKDIGHRLQMQPVYSDQVDQAIATDKFDFLLVHTHVAIKAVSRYRLLGFTDDRKDNVLLFFVRPDSPIQSLNEIKGKAVATPGKQSWATATAMAVARAEAGVQDLHIVPTRLQDAIPVMVELRSVPVGISRSHKLVDEYVKQKRLRVLHQSAPLPLYALLASATVSESVSNKVRAALTSGSAVSEKSYEALPFKAMTYSADHVERLGTFYR